MRGFAHHHAEKLAAALQKHGVELHHGTVGKGLVFKVKNPENWPAVKAALSKHFKSEHLREHMSFELAFTLHGKSKTGLFHLADIGVALKKKQA